MEQSVLCAIPQKDNKERAQMEIQKILFKCEGKKKLMVRVLKHKNSC